MENCRDSDIVREFYDASVQGEWERLERNPYEFDIHRRYFDRYIKPGERVLDIGGGPGRYSLYLAEHGCDVTLVDLSPANVAFALDKAKALGVPLKGVAGNAMVADSLVSGRFDHVLLMGPLYHILQPEGRIRAVNAALNCLKPGGTLSAAFISMYGGMIWWLRDGVSLFSGGEQHDRPLDPDSFFDQMVDELGQVARNEHFDGDAFTRAHFERLCDVLPFFSQFPLEKLHLIGSEGVLAPFSEQFRAAPDNVKQALLDIAAQMCEREELLSYSEHLLYIGKKLK